MIDVTLYGGPQDGAVIEHAGIDPESHNRYAYTTNVRDESGSRALYIVCPACRKGRYVGTFATEAEAVEVMKSFSSEPWESL